MKNELGEYTKTDESFSQMGAKTNKYEAENVDR